MRALHRHIRSVVGDAWQFDAKSGAYVFHRSYLDAVLTRVELDGNTVLMKLADW